MINEQNIRDSIGERVRSYRLKKGITQANLAEIIGTSDHFISTVECGEVNISIHRLVQLADALEVDFLDLIAGSEVSGETLRKYRMLTKKNQKLVDLIIDDIISL